MPPPATTGHPGSRAAAYTCAGRAIEAAEHRHPVGAVVLIGIGLVLLLHTLGVFEDEWIGRAWPMVIIGVGAWLLYRRTQRYAPGRRAMNPGCSSAGCAGRPFSSWSASPPCSTSGACSASAAAGRFT